MSKKWVDYMKLMDIYEHVNNPINNYVKLKQYIDIFFHSKNQLDFCNRVLNNFCTRRYSEYNENVLNDVKSTLARLLFNEWKENVLNTSIKHIPMDKYELDYRFREFLQLQDYLKSVKNIEISFDYELVGESSDESIDNALKKYKFCEKDTEWLYINSYYINIEQQEQMVPEHLLNLNINSKVTLYKFIIYFINECNKRGIKYDLKFSENMYKDNNIIIFSDNSNLIQYIEILCGLEKLNKELFLEVGFSIDRSSPLMGTIGDCSWVGYCSNGANYNSKRLGIIYNAIKNGIMHWYDEEFDKRESDKKDLTYKKYILNEINSNLERKLYREDINTTFEIFYLRRINKAVSQFSQLKWSELEDIMVKIPKGKVITFTKEELYNMIIGLLNTIQRNDIDLLDFIIKEISAIAVGESVDPDKFCIDKDTKESMIAYDTNDDIIMPCTTTKMTIADNSDETSDIYIDSSLGVWSSYNDYLNDKRDKEKIKLKKLIR